MNGSKAPPSVTRTPQDGTDASTVWHFMSRRIDSGPLPRPPAAISVGAGGVTGYLPSSMESPPPASGQLVFGLPLEFLLFGLVLIGVIVFHKRTLEIAWVGLAIIAGVRLGLSHLALVHQLPGEGGKLVNPFTLLGGVNLVPDHFQASHLAALL